MQINEPIINHPRDHIMANTWRLIFERKSQSPTRTAPTTEDFSLLEQILPEYRLIGLSLADDESRRYS